MESVNKSMLRTIVRGSYDLQKLRIETGNRLCANFRAKLGLDPGTKADDQESGLVLKEIERRFMDITSGVIEISKRRKFEYDGVISNYTELNLISYWIDLRQQERKLFKSLEGALESFPIWTDFLKDVRGCGPAMAAVIVSEIDIHNARYPSSLWRYAGLDVARDGAGRSRKKEHLVDVEYEAADGNTKMRKSITFNPFLKTKLVGVLASSFLRVGDNPYRDIYDSYKHRLENHKVHSEKSKGHRHNMAMRYMIKQFLADLYNHWREIEGLPVAPPYHEAKLGIVHSQHM